MLNKNKVCVDIDRVIQTREGEKPLDGSMIAGFFEWATSYCKQTDTEIVFYSPTLIVSEDTRLAVALWVRAQLALWCLHTMRQETFPFSVLLHTPDAPGDPIPLSLGLSLVKMKSAVEAKASPTAVHDPQIRTRMRVDLNLTGARLGIKVDVDRQHAQYLTRIRSVLNAARGDDARVDGGLVTITSTTKLLDLPTYDIVALYHYGLSDVSPGLKGEVYYTFNLDVINGVTEFYRETGRFDDLSRRLIAANLIGDTVPTAESTSMFTLPGGVPEHVEVIYRAVLQSVGYVVNTTPEGWVVNLDEWYLERRVRNDVILRATLLPITSPFGSYYSHMLPDEVAFLNEADQGLTHYSIVARDGLLCTYAKRINSN